jgi:ribosome biogenesis GTPase
VIDLAGLGWNPFFAGHFEPFAQKGFDVGRVAIQHKGHYLVYAAAGELRGEISGRLQFFAGTQRDFPVVGDWAVLRVQPDQKAATIVAVLPRKSKFSRRAAGKRKEEQVLAANIDVAFLVSGLDADFNLRRLERYLLVSLEGGATPVILLNKSDLCPDLDASLRAVRPVAGTTPIHVLSAKRGVGIDAVRSYLQTGVTCALLGSSGVGKSTIINRVLGQEHMKTLEVRATDDKGRHATSHRELILVPGGGLFIDTPGLREIQPLSEADGIQDAFDDIEELALSCKFRDCRHDAEPGCAVRRALEAGSLDVNRLINYQKLQKGVGYEIRRTNTSEAAQRKAKEKRISREYSRWYKRK